MAEFPSLEGLGRSKSGDEYIYGGSVATNRFLGYLRDNAGTGHMFKVLFINCFTLVDNVFSKDLSGTNIYEQFKKEVSLLTIYMDAYNSYFNVPNKTIMVFYIPSYNAIPKDLLRDNSENSTGRVQKAYDYIRGFLPPKQSVMSNTDYHASIFLPIGSGSALPHRELSAWARDLASQKNDLYYYDRSPYGILSHCLIDLHLLRHVKEGVLVERYSGKLKALSDIHTKLDKSGVIPFTPITHRVFGDDVHLAPLVKGRKKTELIQKAEKLNLNHYAHSNLASFFMQELGTSAQELHRLTM